MIFSKKLILILMSDLPFSFCEFRLKQGPIKELNSFGRSVIQNLGFRDIWYFIGQKGIKGYSEFEEVCYSR